MITHRLPEQHTHTHTRSYSFCCFFKQSNALFCQLLGLLASGNKQNPEPNAGETYLVFWRKKIQLLLQNTSPPVHSLLNNRLVEMQMCSTCPVTSGQISMTVVNNKPQTTKQVAKSKSLKHQKPFFLLQIKSTSVWGRGEVTSLLFCPLVAQSSLGKNAARLNIHSVSDTGLT